uniref:Putative secreted protein n=1 Tax=Ixodes ricinus TaxID=34613 RepID=A0A6B0UEE3_IXORI
MCAQFFFFNLLWVIILLIFPVPRAIHPHPCCVRIFQQHRQHRRIFRRRPVATGAAAKWPRSSESARASQFWPSWWAASAYSGRRFSSPCCRPSSTERRPTQTHLQRKH